MSSTSFGQIAWKRDFAILLSAQLAVFSFYLICFYPAIVPGDGAVQWNSVTSGHFNSAYPILYQLLMKVLSKIVDSPSIVAIMQILAIATATSYAFALLRGAGLRLRVLIPLHVFTLAFPVYGIYVVTMRQEVLYAVMVYVSTILLARMQMDNKFSSKSLPWIFLGITLAMIPLFRSNGLLVFVGMPILLFICFRGQARRVAITITFMLLTYGIFYCFSPATSGHMAL